MTTDLTNQIFSCLTVLHRQGSRNGMSYWLCKCQCGNEKVVRAGHLKDGGVRSCGCLRDEGLRARSTKHGKCKNGKKTREYRHQEYLKYRKKLEAMHGADWWRHASQYLYAVNHPEMVRAIRSAYKQRNKAAVLAATRARQALQLRAMPSWANKEAIKAFYAEARRLTELTGIPHEVDHIIPLRGKTVCGLHVEGNLQVIPATVNRRKWRRVLL